jgi:hypothetical protein
MIRLLHVLSGVSILLAGSVCARCVRQWSQGDPAWDALLARPGATEIFLQRAREIPPDEKMRVSPLLAEASAFAAYLNPPVPVQERPVVQEAPKPAPPTPAVRPPAVSPKFKVCGTSCCDDRPERSMALILEPGNTESVRWVKPGTQVGHSVIQEIRPGSVVYSDGEQVQEMAIERDVAAMTVTAQGSSPAGNRPPVVTATTAQSAASTKRPTRSRSMTVGTARTAALD